MNQWSRKKQRLFKCVNLSTNHCWEFYVAWRLKKGWGIMSKSDVTKCDLVNDQSIQSIAKITKISKDGWYERLQNCLYNTLFVYDEKRSNTLRLNYVYVLVIHEALMCGVDSKSMADKNLLWIKIAALMTDVACRVGL